MRVVVFGATGNVGTAVIRRLAVNPLVTEITGVARRRPSTQVPKVQWVSRDLANEAVGDLVSLLSGANAVIHLAWLIQPARDEVALRRTNVEGTRRLVEAAIEAGIPSFVYASSVGAYSRGPKDRAVDETWPATGISTSVYSRQKAEVEAYLDTVEDAGPRIVRLRTALVFQRTAASEISRFFLGPLAPTRLIGRGRLPVIPDFDRLSFQVVHSDDAAAAYETAVFSDARGAYNVATEPAIEGPQLAELLGARRLPVPFALVRAGVAASYALRLQPTSPGWVDLAAGVPTMDSGAARRDLGWRPRFDAQATLDELLEGMAEGVGGPTPPLAPT